MIYKWNINGKDKDIEIKLDYNVFLKRKKLYIDEREEIIVNKNKKFGVISFRIEDEGYEIQLTPDNYGYSGQLIIPGGEILTPVNVNKSPNIILPIWVLPFIVVNFLIPVISVEAVTPWIIGIISSYLIVRIENRGSLVKKTRIKYYVAITIAAWAAYLIFCFCTNQL